MYTKEQLQHFMDQLDEMFLEDGCKAPRNPEDPNGTGCFVWPVWAVRAYRLALDRLEIGGREGCGPVPRFYGVPIGSTTSNAWWYVRQDGSVRILEHTPDMLPAPCGECGRPLTPNP